MPMPSEIVDGYLLVRSVGNHDLESGFRDMMAAMDKAKVEYERTGVKIVMLLDLLESEEERNASDVSQIAEFFRQCLGFLDGRIAFFVTKADHYGLTRMFSALTAPDGLDIRPFYDMAEAKAFLGIADQNVG